MGKPLIPNLCNVRRSLPPEPGFAKPGMSLYRCTRGVPGTHKSRLFGDRCLMSGLPPNRPGQRTLVDVSKVPVGGHQCPAVRRMVRFLRRRGRGQGKALTFGGRCRNLRCTEPRAKSSGYGDLIELVAAALSESKGRMCGGSAASWAFAGGSVCSLAILLAR